MHTEPPVGGFGERVLKGIPASPGIAIGKTFVLSMESPIVVHEHIPATRIPDEIQMFQNAVATAVEELARASEIAKQESETVSTIIESYLLIVSDRSMIRTVTESIQGGMAAEVAVLREFDRHKASFQRAKDPILRERAQDFEHVKERLLAILRNKSISLESASDSIIIAGSITPQDLLFFKETRNRAFVTELGGITAHTSIMARDLLIPAVIGIRNVTSAVGQNEIIIVDGYSGLVIVEPTAETLAQYELKLQQEASYKAMLGELAHQDSVTLDGTTVRLSANVDTPAQAERAMMMGAGGIGLVRTEALLTELGGYPSLQQEYEWYAAIAQRAFPKQVTFRAFDVGADKFRDGIPIHEHNPALGLRGIRFLLYRQDIFVQQVKAVLKASEHRNVRLMLPMITVIEEIHQALHIIRNCALDLEREGVAFDKSLPIGIMIETPSAALLAEEFVPLVDFVSIGTNDLAQYTLATDRTNEMVADIYDAMHPSVLRLIRMIVQATNRFNKPVSVCGEMAGHSAATEMLLRMGIVELSVSPSLLLEVKQRIRNSMSNA